MMPLIRLEDVFGDDLDGTLFHAVLPADMLSSGSRDQDRRAIIIKAAVPLPRVFS